MKRHLIAVLLVIMTASSGAVAALIGAGSYLPAAVPTLGTTTISSTTFTAAPGDANLQIGTLFTPVSSPPPSSGTPLIGYTIVTGCGANCANSASFLIPPKPLTVTLGTPVALAVGDPVGKTISTATCTMSNGSSCVTTLTTSDTSFFAISGMNIVTQHALTAADQGTHLTTITATGGNTIDALTVGNSDVVCTGTTDCTYKISVAATYPPATNSPKTQALALTSHTTTPPTGSQFDATRNTGNVYSFSTNNTTATYTAAATSNSSAFVNTFHSSGKWIFQTTLATCPSPGGTYNCGVGMATTNEPTAGGLGHDNLSFGFYGNGFFGVNNAFSGGGLRFGNVGDVVAVIVDINSQTAQLVVNGTMGAVKSIAGMSGYSLSPAVTIPTQNSAVSYTGNPTTTYGITTWDGTGVTLPTPTGVTPTVASIVDTTTPGSIIVNCTVAMSDGSAFPASGTIGFATSGNPTNSTHPNGLFGVPGGSVCQLTAASPQYVGADDGTYTAQLNVCANGTCVQPTIAVSIVSASSQFDVSRNTGSVFAFSNSNKTATYTSATTSNSSAFTTLFHSTGKWIFQNIMGTCPSPGGTYNCTVGMASATEPTVGGLGHDNLSFGFTGNGFYGKNNVFSSSGMQFTSGDTVSIIVDLGLQTAQLVVNGNNAAVQSISGLSTFNLSPAVTIPSQNSSMTYTGNPTTTYGITTWDGTQPPPPTPTGISPNSITVADSIPAGTNIIRCTVSMSDGTAFPTSGTIAFATGGNPTNSHHPSGLFALPGATTCGLNAASPNYTSADDGTFTARLSVCANGTCIQPTITVTINPSGGGGLPGSILPSGTTGWVVGFDEEFPGTSLNTNVWDLPADGSSRYGDLQRCSNILTINNGTMSMIHGGQPDNYGCDITTLNGFTFGYYEANVKTSNYPDGWGGFWTINTGQNSCTTPSGSGTGFEYGFEADIIETNVPASEQHLFWDGYSSCSQHRTVASNLPHGDTYHIYGLWIQPTGMTFYVDGSVSGSYGYNFPNGQFVSGVVEKMVVSNTFISGSVDNGLYAHWVRFYHQ